mgnify:CR=1 FL=1|tara:strand:- start:264 stop:497 length:234 start_codon:yes stop_codon:yes gene_type:complete
MTAREHAKKILSAKGKGSYNAQLDESLAMRNKKESKEHATLKARRDESKGEAKSMGKRAYSGVRAMDKYKRGATPHF